MAKVKNISGFPEWLPTQRFIEQQLMVEIERVYRSFGFVSVETPSVELLTTLTANGVADKEIYVLRRAHDPEDGDAGGDEGTLALHFDLTVPFARYVAQHLNSLVFPFKRYSMQKVWRGERPQRGRFREFYQCDIDIVAREDLPLACDAEVITVIDKALCQLRLPPHQLRMNNRKILQGFYESVGIGSDIAPAVIVEVDKIDKIGRQGVAASLSSQLGLSATAIDEVLALASWRLQGSDVEGGLQSLAGRNGLLDQGLEEVLRIWRLLPTTVRERMSVEGSLARGLFYYTGLIFEVTFPSFPEFGSVAGGGRYEGLAGRFANARLPSVGASIGLTRLLSLIFEKELLPCGAQSSTQLLITLHNEEQRAEANRIAEEVRGYGVPCEVYLKAVKLGKQLEYALAKAIPYVGFIDDATHTLSVKDLAAQSQEPVRDLKAWCLLRQAPNLLVP